MQTEVYLSPTQIESDFRSEMQSLVVMLLQSLFIKISKNHSQKNLCWYKVKGEAIVHQFLKNQLNIFLNRRSTTSGILATAQIRLLVTRIVAR